MSRYCKRCDRVFVHSNALAQHVQYSGNHWTCSVCGYDAFSREQLMSHYSKRGCMVVCSGCFDGLGCGFPDNASYRQHLRDDHVCRRCGRHFSSSSNLSHHMITHRNPDVECHGCERTFTTYAGMIIHLESGTCDSGIDIIDINESAAKCYQWAHFIQQDYRDDMLECEDPQDFYRYKVYPYICPTCEAVFPMLSSLFMHVASASCSQTLDSGAIGKLKHWLWLRHA